MFDWVMNNWNQIAVFWFIGMVITMLISSVIVGKACVKQNENQPGQYFQINFTAHFVQCLVWPSYWVSRYTTIYYQNKLTRKYNMLTGQQHGIIMHEGN